MAPPGHLKMKELAERSGVSPATIKHYLREGLLGDGTDVVRTSRNMAWYPEEYVERLQLIKRLQEQRYMPLRVIAQMLEEGGTGRLKEALDAEDRLLDRLEQRRGDERVPRKEVLARYELPENALARLAEIGVLTPTRQGYDQDDIAIIEAMVRFRASGYDERIGFTVYDTLRYRKALEQLVREEARLILDRLAGQMDPDAASEMLASSAEPVRALLGALHAKLLAAELRRHRGG